MRASTDLRSASVTSAVSSSVLEVRCPAHRAGKTSRCGKLLLKIVRPTSGTLDLCCTRCGHTFRQDVKLVEGSTRG